MCIFLFEFCCNSDANCNVSGSQALDEEAFGEAVAGVEYNENTINPAKELGIIQVQVGSVITVIKLEIFIFPRPIILLL